MNNTSLPQSAPAVSVAFLLGASDAEAGIACVPEMFFVTRLAMAAYCRGYAAVNGHNDTTRFFLPDAEDLRFFAPASCAKAIEERVQVEPDGDCLWAI